MSFLPTISGEFFVITEPEMNFSPSGDAVVRARAKADNSRKMDDGTYKTTKEVIVSLSGWRELAQRFVDQVGKNTPVLISGDFSERKYNTKDGEPRTDLLVDMKMFEVIIRGNRQNNQQQGGQQQNNQQGGQQQGQQQQGGYQQGNQQGNFQQGGQQQQGGFQQQGQQNNQQQQGGMNNGWPQQNPGQQQGQQHHNTEEPPF